MNLHHLQYFAKLAHLEHYTKAASELAITQPTLSHAISQLESELGIPLFEKSGRNIILTKHGKIFLEEIQKALDIIDNSVNTIRLTNVGEGRIDLGLLRTLGTHFVPELVDGFLKSHPTKSIDFRFSCGVTYDLIQGLKQKDFDLVFCSMKQDEPTINFIPVAKEHLYLIVPLDHPLASKDCIDLVETLPYPQIIFSKESGLRAIVDDLFQQIGGYPSVFCEIDEDQVIAGMVAKNFGIAIVPDMPILDLMSVKKLEINSPSWERIFYIATLKNTYMSPVVTEFINYISENAHL